MLAAQAPHILFRRWRLSHQIFCKRFADTQMSICWLRNDDVFCWHLEFAFSWRDHNVFCVSDVEQVPGSLWAMLCDVEQVPASFRGRICDVEQVPAAVAGGRDVEVAGPVTLQRAGTLRWQG